jgi:hypothetical protein
LGPASVGSPDGVGIDEGGHLDKQPGHQQQPTHWVRRTPANEKGTDDGIDQEGELPRRLDHIGARL